ncbi:hypothetical protein SLEP1_g21293 [Rubroshorea leprosula]|uniref:Uncharacterized protein n=1 Tax=Rubroshorea leprosula TaxID=152421 RepID=A0AAV5JEM0_9ROSI|nr:hypothetical protein SLEP1_g21293 [Rubroshorea leprosula]
MSFPADAAGPSPKLQSGFCWGNSSMLTAPPSLNFIN